VALTVDQLLAKLTETAEAGYGWAHVYLEEEGLGYAGCVQSVDALHDTGRGTYLLLIGEQSPPGSLLTEIDAAIAAWQEVAAGDDQAAKVAAGYAAVQLLGRAAWQMRVATKVVPA